MRVLTWLLFATTSLLTFDAFSQNRPIDPWVFRSVLDGQPRVVTAALNADLYVAYNAADGSLYKAWKGGVKFDGAVYTTAHGPQPSSEGSLYLHGAGSPWAVVADDVRIPMTGRYVGHRFEGDQVIFSYELTSSLGHRVVIDEKPEYRRGRNGAAGIERLFRVRDHNRDFELELRLHADSLDAGVRYRVAGGSVHSQEGQQGEAATLRMSTTQPALLTMEFDRYDSADIPGNGADTALPTGLVLIEASDCRICHSHIDRTVGPSWTQIAARYLTTTATVDALATKVIEGGSGEWGNATMTPHRDLSIENAREMVRYILSLDDDDEVAADSTATDTGDNGSASGQEHVVTVPMTLVGPVVDGNIDEVWDAAAEVEVDRPVTSGSTGTVDAPQLVKLLYDASYLYALFEVDDPVRKLDSEDAYYDDAVEIYLDGGYEREEYFDENDVQYIFPADGSDIWINGDATRHVGVEYAVSEVDGGYVSEIKIPFENVGIVPVPGLRFGIQFHVDDDDTGGDTAVALSWSTNEPASWHNTSLFGTAILGDSGDQPLIATLSRIAGLRMNAYDLQKSIPNLLRLVPNQLPNVSKIIPTIDLATAADFGGLEDQFLVEIDGFVEVGSSGDYTFRLTSDDGSMLWLDNRVIIDNDGLHGEESRDAVVNLTAGHHTVRVRYFDAGGGQRLLLEWRQPGADDFEVVPPGLLSSRSVAEERTSTGRKFVIEPPVRNRPGDTVSLEGVHPAFDVVTIRPESFKPRVGGMDFLSDGRLVICTWDAEGAVYILDNVQEREGAEVGVKKIGSGLAEPLGLKIVDDQIYVLQKQELTHLIDHDGDEVIDEYRTVANSWGVTSNFHEFAFGLIFQDGFFYATLATAIDPGGASTSPQNPDRGKVVRIGLDGSVDFIAHGLRTPNGIGMDDSGRIFVTDNQGDWLPSSKLVHVREDAFFGNRSVDPERTATIEETPPVVWMPQDEIGNSPSQPVISTHGPYAGQLLYGEVTHGGLKRVFLEEVDGQLQGALFRFTQGLEAGINRVVIGPDDAIYVGGVGSAGNWGQTGKKKHGLQRLDYNGNVPFEMLAVRAKSNGLEIEFTKPLADGAGGNKVDYDIHQWRYQPTADYGGPKIDEQKLPVSSATVSEDRRRVFLEVPGMKAGHVVYIRLRNPIASTTGEQPWSTEVWYTLNAIPSGRPGIVEDHGVQNNELDAHERDAGFEILFDGTSLNGWEAYKADIAVDKWIVTDGTLSFQPDKDGQGGDLATTAEYADFELRLEWKVEEAGNSGIFYRVDRTLDFPWESGPEMQVLDNRGHPDGRNPLTSAGANYALHAAVFDASRPPGEWNEVRLVVDGDHVEHWLNGNRIVSYTLWNDDWRRRVRSSKFSDMPAYGLARKGHIVLQDHGDPVWYRNIRIRVLNE